MKRTAAILIALTLAACQTGGSPAFWSKISSTSADIVNSLPLACDAAQSLLALPAVTNSSGKVRSKASAYAAKFSQYCTTAQLDGPALALALQLLNTAGAELLGTGVADKRS